MTKNDRTCTFPGCVNTRNGATYCHGHENQRTKGRELTPLRPHNRVTDGRKVCSSCGENKPVERFHKKLGAAAPQCIDCRSIADRCKAYGLTPDEVRALMERPCDACGQTVENGKHRHIDHDHTTGAVRGVLCHGCNTSLGLMNESPELLRRLAEYIESHRA